jgi:hypothetical protein
MQLGAIRQAQPLADKRGRHPVAIEEMLPAHDERRVSGLRGLSCAQARHHQPSGEQPHDAAGLQYTNSHHLAARLTQPVDAPFIVVIESAQ